MMSLDLVGIVYYADDPERKVFRIVYPQLDDAELDLPPTDGAGSQYLDEEGKTYGWTTLGTDPERKAIMEKVSRGDPRIKLTGTP